MSGFQSRWEQARPWELMVQAWLISNGWIVEEFGQGMLSEKARDIIHGFDTDIRWLPDIIARRMLPEIGSSALIIVDAKNSPRHARTGNHAVETRSTEVALKFHGPKPIHALYAFPHGDMPGFVSVPVWHALAEDRPYLGSGSGTPFRVAPCVGLCRPTPQAAITLLNEIREEETA